MGLIDFIGRKETNFLIAIKGGGGGPKKAQLVRLAEEIWGDIDQWVSLIHSLPSEVPQFQELVRRVSWCCLREGRAWINKSRYSLCSMLGITGWG